MATNPVALNTYSDIVCVNQIINIKCISDTNITITRAIWGKYDTPCFDFCCSPDTANDCTLDVETTEPDLFAYIKNDCDGKQSCDVTYYAYLLNECEDEYLADYLRVFFDCLPIDRSEPVGFSVYLAEEYEVFISAGEIVPFDSVISNYGNYFSTVTHTFTCPFNGVYTFWTSINQSSFSTIRSRLMRNDTELMTMWADGEGARDSVSASVITECNSGEQVYIETLSSGYIDGGDSACHFTGFLLYLL